MKKLIKISFIGIFILLLAIPKQVNAIVNPTKEFYVNDYANILSEKTKNYKKIEGNCKKNHIDFQDKKAYP